jgi:hypothetical protein
MKMFIRTQIISFFFGVAWLLLLNILTILQNPKQFTIKYMNGFLWIFAFFLTISLIINIRKYIGRKWTALPLIFLPYVLIYQFFFPLMQKSIGIGNKAYYVTFDYLTLSTIPIMTASLLIGTFLGILLSKKLI